MGTEVKFKVGDRVKVGPRGLGGVESVADLEATVVSWDGVGYRVRFDNEYPNDSGDFSDTWYVSDTTKISLVTPETPSATQVGGSHYSSLAFQPFAYIQANNLGFAEGNVVKYVSRWKAKGGVEDLKKARHYLDLLIEAEEFAS